MWVVDRKQVTALLGRWGSESHIEVPPILNSHYNELRKAGHYQGAMLGYKGEWSPGGFDQEALAKMSDGLQLIGDSPGPVDWKAAIDQQFLPKDLQKPF